MVIHFSVKPYCVLHWAEHIYLAMVSFVSRRLKHPSDIIFETPNYSVPMADRVVVPEHEFVVVDLELGGSDNPVRCRIVWVIGINVCRVGGVLQVEVEVDSAVAAQNGRQGLLVKP